MLVGQADEGADNVADVDRTSAVSEYGPISKGFTDWRDIVHPTQRIPKGHVSLA